MKPRTSLTNSESRRLTMFILYASIFFGITVGSCVFAFIGRDMSHNVLFSQYISPLNSGETLFQAFKYSALTYTVYITVLMLAGFFVFGNIAGVALVIYRGTGIGIAVGSLYLTFGVKAMLLTLLLIVPKILATTVIVILAARESMRLSSKLYRFLFREDSIGDGMRKFVKLYFIKFLILELFMVLIAVLESVLNYLLIDFCV